MAQPRFGELTKASRTTGDSGTSYRSAEEGDGMDYLARAAKQAERYEATIHNQREALTRLQKRIATLEGHVQVHHSELHEVYDGEESGQAWACDYQETT